MKNRNLVSMLALKCYVSDNRFRKHSTAQIKNPAGSGVFESVDNVCLQ